VLTKEELIKLVSGKEKEQEEFYVEQGPDKHTQEDHYQEGVSVVRMNYDLLVEWIGQNDDSFMMLSAAQQREVWEASSFHYGMMGYDQDDADFFWQKKASLQAKREQANPKETK